MGAGGGGGARFTPTAGLAPAPVEYGGGAGSPAPYAPPGTERASEEDDLDRLEVVEVARPRVEVERPTEVAAESLVP